MIDTQIKKVHVIFRDGRWIVRGERLYDIKSIHPTQSEAIKSARLIAQDEQGELVIHSETGRIRDRKNYYSGPLPPKKPRTVLFPKMANKERERQIKEAIREIARERNNLTH